MLPDSGIPVRPSFLPGHSNSGSISQNQSLDSFIPAKPRRMCSYVADPTRSLCVHRKTGSSGTATHPRSPTLHLSILGFRCFNRLALKLGIDNHLESPQIGHSRPANTAQRLNSFYMDAINATPIYNIKL